MRQLLLYFHRLHHLFSLHPSDLTILLLRLNFRASASHFHLFIIGQTVLQPSLEGKIDFNLSSADCMHCNKYGQHPILQFDICLSLTADIARYLLRLHSRSKHDRSYEEKMQRSLQSCQKAVPVIRAPRTRRAPGARKDDYEGTD